MLMICFLIPVFILLALTPMGYLEVRSEINYNYETAIIIINLNFKLTFLNLRWDWCFRNLAWVHRTTLD